jgi:N-methylhydantoinase B
MTIDPITIEVVTNRIREIAATMEHALYHSGYSPILRESKDGTAGLADADGRVVIIGGGLQYHSLGYEQAVRSVLARYPRETLRPGDSFVVNDPYLGGNPHAPDMVAHKADIGGLVPGSSGANAREIYHDGLLLPPVRYRDADGVNEVVEAILRNNSRVPDVVLGDLRGQVGATRVGVERLAALCDEYGAATIRHIMREILTRTTTRVRAEIAAMDDGTGEGEGYLDHDGAVKDRPVRFHVVARKDGDRLTLDFSGSSPQTRGPVNVLASTARAGSLLALIAATDPTIPVNSGVADAIEFVLPRGSVVDPQHPATMNLYAPALHLLYNCVLAALGQLNPARAVAPSGLGTGALAIGYRGARAEKPAVQYELLCTALGGTSSHDGAPIVQGMNHITPGTPVEVLESEYPIRVRRFDVRCDSAGPGTYRGGVAYVREYELLEDAIMTARTTNHRFTAWGLAGGGSPPPARATINPDRPDREAIEPIVTRELVAGDVLSLELSGGGGYGDPFARDPAAVCADVRNGYVSIAAAAEHYGVVIDAEKLEVDLDATERRRRVLTPTGGTTHVG